MFLAWSGERHGKVAGPFSVGKRKKAGRATENGMKKEKILLITTALLSAAISCPAIATEPSVPSVTLCYVAIIEQVCPDGTLVLNDGKKLLLPGKAVGHEAVKPKEEVVILTKAGVTHQDTEGRIQGWALILDLAGPEMSAEPGKESRKPESAITPLQDAETRIAGRSTVAIPAGMGMKLFAEQAATLASLEMGGKALLEDMKLSGEATLPGKKYRGATIFLENGREIWMAKNIFRFPAVVQKHHRLLFCAR